MRRRPEDRVARYLDDLLSRRRPRRFKASAEELEAMSAAAELVQARAGADLPDPRFVENLSQKLRSELDPEPVRPRAFSRRSVLGTVATAAAAAVVGGVVDHGLVVQQATQESGTLIPNSGQWRPVAAVKDLPEGQAMALSTGSMQVMLVNDSGTIRALSGVCTHLGCVLKPRAEARLLECPCHGTTFAMSGKVMAYHLARRPSDLPAVESRVRGGQIEVYVV